MGKSSQGCRVPDSAEVEAHLRAGAPWTRNRDIPDVAGWEDLVAAPEEVSECLDRRIADGRCPMPPSVVSLPKTGTNELRKVTWMDPLDELWYRILVGRMVRAIESSLAKGPAEVFSSRVVETLPAWVVQSKGVWPMFDKRTLKLLSKACCRAMGTFDIRHYFPSIVPDQIASVLTGLAVPAREVYLLKQFLMDLTELGAASGLPIGAESSGLIGNVMLIAVDEALAPLVMAHLRFSDDSRVFMHDASTWNEIVKIYEETAGRYGLAVNKNKLALYTKESDDVIGAIRNERIDYMMAFDHGLVSPEVAVEEIKNQIEADTPDWRALKFGLGALIKGQSAIGLSAIYHNPTIFVETPTHTGRYLMTLASDRRLKGQIDRDWLVEFAAEKPTGRSIAAQIQACRVVERLGVSKSHGRRFEEVAMSSNSDNRSIPFKAWAAMAWGASHAHSPGAAVDHASDVGDFKLRRAFVLTINPEASTEKSRQKWCRHLSAREPDLKPSLARLR